MTDEGTSPHRCVYTAIIGAYDALVEPAGAALASGIDFICFTDDPSLTSAAWDVRVVTPRLATDGVRSARSLKILGHDDLREYDETLYIDASVRLRQDPSALLDDWLAGADFALAAHSYREQLLDEFDEVVRLNYDDRTRVHEQLYDYASLESDVLNHRPFWTGMLARRNVDSVRDAMTQWYDHVLRYSRRDQLSLPVVLSGRDLRVNRVDLDNFSSHWHEWPVITGRKISAGKSNHETLGPVLSDLRREQRRAADLDAELRARDPETAALVEEVNGLRAQVQQGTQERQVLEQRLNDALREQGRLAERFDLQAGSIATAGRHLLHAIRQRAGRLWARASP